MSANKDIIYIDVEDDITAIIGKVKASKDKIIALVPPKRTGVLQSAVNLRLLARTAKTDSKSLVLITNDQALSGLAAAAKIPVAKNLQSKPELAEIPALGVDDGDDIIDGSELPVGELAKTTDANKVTTGNKKVDEIIDNLDDSSEQANTPSKRKALAGSKPAKQKGAKVPDYKKFRKRLFIIIGAVIAVVGFLIWAIWFAPAAKIIITAQTTDEQVNTKATLVTASTNARASQLKSETKQLSQESSVEFEATGTQTKGNKATGTLTLTRALGGSVSVPAGASFSNGNYTFVTTSSVVVPGRGVPVGEADPVNGTVDVSVVATDIGPEYNLSARSYLSSISGVTAYGSQMSGGSRETVKIVTASDVQAAGEKLVEQSGDSYKNQLMADFDNTYTIIEDSFTADRADAVSSPAVGEEVSGKAKLTSQVTYSLAAVANVELETYLNDVLEAKLSDDDKTDQRVYDSGASEANLTGYSKNGDTQTVNISATGKIGPKIDEEAIKEQSRGKRYGEVQSEIEKLEGVSSVDVKFSFFWVRTVPDNVDKIKIEFDLQDD